MFPYEAIWVGCEKYNNEPMIRVISRVNENNKDMSKKKVINICFYHNEDLDGYACAAVFHEATTKHNENAYLHGIDYVVKDNLAYVQKAIDNICILAKLDETEIVEVEISSITICDYSFSPSVMKYLVSNYSIIWIDHHESAIADSINNYYDSIAGIRQVGIGACYLAYCYFNKIKVDDDTKVPNSIRALALYDVFNFNDFVDGKDFVYDESDIRDFQAYMNYAKTIYGVATHAVNINDNKFYLETSKFFVNNINDVYYKSKGNLIREIEKNTHVSNCVNNGIYRRVMTNTKMVANNAFVVIGFFGSFDNAIEADAIKSVTNPKGKADLIINIIPLFKGCKIRIYTPDGSKNASEIAKNFPNGGGHARVAGAQITNYILLPDDTLYLM